MWRPWSEPAGESSSESVSEPAGESSSEPVSEPVTFDHKPKLSGRGIHLTKGQQEVVRAMVKYAKENGAPNPVADATKVLGVSPGTVYKYLAVTPTTPKKRGKQIGKYTFSRIDDFQRKVIQRTIYEKYANNTVPTVPQLLRILKLKDPSFNYSERHLRRIIRNLGFKFSKLDRRGKVMMCSRIIKLRDLYLGRVQQLMTEEVPLIFLDETW